MELSPRKKLMASILAGVGITAGAAGIAGAVTSPSATAPVARQVVSAAPAATPVTPTPTPAPAAETPGTETTDPKEAPGTPEVSDPAGGTDTAQPSYTGSVTAPQSQGANETDESAALQPLAKISAADATKAALAAVPGTASTATLENENGNVVYSVVVTTSTGSVDVKVDAGNGKVLSQDAGGNESGGSSETANG
jgi:hypothetical protein